MSGQIILGGGIAGLSFAYFYDNESIIIEKEKTLGGLCRSFYLNNIAYDLGPHIIFSKHADILDLHTSLIETAKIKRSNQILYKGSYVKYPFENDLAALSTIEKNYCLTEFLNNPYEDYHANNMLQFFLKTFGEGITKLYLQPYNEKIWKFDPSFLDLQMVERIPKPPRDDVIRSAQGVKTEGYLHQLYFSYPKQGGFQSLIDAYTEKLVNKTQLLTNTKIISIQKKEKEWQVTTDKGKFSSPILINCMPLPELFSYIDVPENISKSIKALYFNAMHIIVAQFKRDAIGHHFALYIPDKEIIFHRLSKLNFLGPAYSLPNGASTLVLEVTFRPHSFLSQLSEEEIKARVLRDLTRLKLVQMQDLLDITLHTLPYAYVIYDLNHQKNVTNIIAYLKQQNILCCGRFAEFEYLNSDQVVHRSKKLAFDLNREHMHASIL